MNSLLESSFSTDNAAQLLGNIKIISTEASVGNVILGFFFSYQALRTQWGGKHLELQFPHILCSLP